MRVVVAIDSFKGSLSSREAGEAVKTAVLRAQPNATVTVCPLADGGEGTVEALYEGMNGRMVETVVTGPLGAPVTARYAILADGITAVVEMAAAAGITLVPPTRRDPMLTTTFGVGELLCDAMRQGCRRFIVGIGGSATNDGGAGMLQALGFTLSRADGTPISRGAAGLKELAHISAENVLPTLRECSFRVACDVTNPLCGPTGCSAVFGPQKGANTEAITAMDTWLSHYAALTKEVAPSANPDAAGAGAAGGLGFAFMAFTNAVLESGVTIVLEETCLEKHIQQADIVVTGEGRLDGQTVMGKAPIGVAKLAKKHQKRTLAFAGCVTDDAVRCNEHGIDAFFPILRNVCTLEEALDPTHASQNLTETAYQVFRLLKETNDEHTEL